MELSAKQLWPRMNYLLLDEGLRPALAVGLDAANIVGRGAVQYLQKLLQGGLQNGVCGVRQGSELLRSIRWALVRDFIKHLQ